MADAMIRHLARRPRNRRARSRCVLTGDLVLDVPGRRSLAVRHRAGAARGRPRHRPPGGAAYAARHGTGGRRACAGCDPGESRRAGARRLRRRDAGRQPHRRLRRRRHRRHARAARRASESRTPAPAPISLRARARRCSQCRRHARRAAELQLRRSGGRLGDGSRAGCNYLRVRRPTAAPWRPRRAARRSRRRRSCSSREDIAAARATAGLVIVALHKGIVHTPARLAPYERALAAAAVDAGADIVVGHHAHIVRGIELYRGRPIFHGLGNGCVVTHALTPAQDHPARAEWARRRRKLFGFEPDPAYALAPFHPEAVNAMLGLRSLARGRHGSRSASIPVYVEPPGRPVLADGGRAEADRRATCERITRAAGLPRAASGRRGGARGCCSERTLHRVARAGRRRRAAGRDGDRYDRDASAGTLGLPLLGSIEIVQVAVLVAGAAALLIATLRGRATPACTCCCDRCRLRLRTRAASGCMHSRRRCCSCALLVGSFWIARRSVARPRRKRAAAAAVSAAARARSLLRCSSDCSALPAAAVAAGGRDDRRRPDTGVHRRRRAAGAAAGRHADRRRARRSSASAGSR